MEMEDVNENEFEEIMSNRSKPGNFSKYSDSEEKYPQKP